MGIKGSFTFISFPCQSKSVWHKRYSDHNSAAIMLDRTRGKKKQKSNKKKDRIGLLAIELRPRDNSIQMYTERA